MSSLILNATLAMLPVIVGTTTSNLSNPINTPGCQQWVDSVYNTLSERERVEQLAIPCVNPNQGEASKAVIRKEVETNHVGGLIFDNSDAEAYATMINYAQSISKVPLLMTIDGEWGPAMRLKDAPKFPKNMGLGAIQDENLLFRYGIEVARECRALGIQVDFAPTIDVNSNPANPVIGQRSYGENPYKVAQLGTAFSLGLEAGGVMAVGKHFPGHGDTSTDSHKTLPQVNRNYQQLDSVELLPFKKFIASKCNGIMVGHISVPALDKSLAPASMSHKITTGLLKDKLGFQGLIFTDGLGMKGAAVKGSNAVAALKAGADMLLCISNTKSEVDAIMAAISKGEISKQAIAERCKKVLAYKYALGLTRRKPVDVANIKAILNSPEADAMNRELADASVTVLRNNHDILPIGNLGHNSIAVVNIGKAKGNDFDKMCAKYAHIQSYSGIGDLAKIKQHNTVIAAVYNDDQSSRAALATLSKLPNLVTVFMVNPYKMAKFRTSLTDADAILIVYDDTKYTEEAAAKALFGGISVNGKLPVNLNGFMKMGTGIDLKKTRLGYSSPEQYGFKPDFEARIDSAINASLKMGAFPGGQLIIAKDGDIIIDKSFGTITKGGAQVDNLTLYDLASVSKTVGTLPGVMKAYDLGLFQLDEPASEIIPGLNQPGKSDLTPRNLLYHETGIAPSMDMFTMMMDPLSYAGKLYTAKPDKVHSLKVYNGIYANPKAKLRTDILSTAKSDAYNHEAAKGIFVSDITYDSIMNRIYRSNLRNNRNYLYSCLNFCLLMDMEQRLTHQPHDRWVTDSIWTPIGAYTFCYRPTENALNPENIASTENDPFLRRQHVKGYVHDELAAFSGGVQGNAGVFGTATDVAKLCQLWLNDGQYGDARVFSPETSKLFTTEKSKNSRRGLGFDKPDMTNSENSPTCDEASASVYGHTGFTGTCFWVDPEENLIYVFLCNRVDPTRNNQAFSKSSIRPTLMSIVYQSLK